MPKQVKLRRGTTAQHATFTGAAGELTVDTTKKTVVVHDGITAGGCPLALESGSSAVKTGNLLWVDAVNGNDATAVRGRLSAPFLTLTAAKLAAIAGDTIIVLPGTYNEKNLAKNGVNWHFENGAVISYSGMAAGGVFDTAVAGGICAFNVTGRGVFKVLSEPAPAPVLKSFYGGDAINLECERIDALGAAIEVAGTVSVRCHDLKSSSTGCVSVFASAVLSLRANKISSSGGNAVEVSGGVADIDARWISSTAGKGVRFSAGVLYLTAYEVSSTTDYALEYASAYSTLCRVHHARLVSTAAGGAGKAVYVSAGSTNLRLVNCTLVGAVPATASIDTPAATTVVLYGECVANLAKGANVTVVGSALTVNSLLT